MPNAQCSMPKVPTKLTGGVKEPSAGDGAPRAVLCAPA